MKAKSESSHIGGAAAGSNGYAAEQVLEAAIDVACRYGVAEVGPRPLAVRKGVHRSAVNYHFGGQEQLVGAVRQRLLQGRLEELQRTVERLSSQPAHLVSMPSFFVAVVAQDAFSNSGRAAFLAEVVSAATADGAPPEFDLAIDDALRNAWRAAADTLGEGHNWEAWYLLAAGAPSFAMLAHDDPLALGWLVEVANRFSDRLVGRKVVAARGIDTGSDTPFTQLEQYGGEQARLVIDAAARQLVECGGRLTYRAIAAAAGVPLSTTKYLFPNRWDLIVAAYLRLHAVMLARSGPVATQPISMGEPFSVDGVLQGHTVAIERLGIMVRRDPQLGFLGTRMQRMRGRMAELQLRANGVSDADQLDGLIWSLLVAGVLAGTRILPAAERAERFRIQARRLAAQLFRSSAL